MGGDKFVVMSFLAKVEMRRNRMFEEVRHQVSGKNKDGSIFFTQVKAGRDNFQHGRGQHEAGPKSDEIFEIRPVPVLLNNDGSAEDNGCGGCRAKQQTEKDWVHGCRMIAEPSAVSCQASGKAIDTICHAEHLQVRRICNIDSTENSRRWSGSE